MILVFEFFLSNVKLILQALDCVKKINFAVGSVRDPFLTCTQIVVRISKRLTKDSDVAHHLLAVLGSEDTTLGRSHSLAKDFLVVSCSGFVVNNGKLRDRIRCGCKVQRE